MTQPPPDTEAVKAFNAKITEEFRANNGKVGAFEGTELLLLTTTGATSGQPRLWPLSCRRVDGKLLSIAGSGGRVDETVTMWRQTWDGRGEFADALPAARSGGPPVWLAGGDTTKVIERVSTIYDGWLPYLPDPTAYARAWDRIRAQAVREVTP